MSTEEKIDLMFEYVRADYLLAEAIINKNDAVRKQDFQKAIVFRDSENELRALRLLKFEKVFNYKEEVNPSNQK